MVYSTCSINPLEDEAVVAALLSKYGADLELVDIAEERLLRGCRWRPGISSWECNLDTLLEGESDRVEREKSASMMPAILPSMQAPDPGEGLTAMHLDRCMRILPHDQDTGGFFVAVLEKKKSLSSIVRTESTISSSSSIVVDHSHVRNDRELLDVKSMGTMKRLGYNPKITAFSSTNSSKLQSASSTSSTTSTLATLATADIIETCDNDTLLSQSNIPAMHCPCRFHDVPKELMSQVGHGLGIDPTKVDMNYFTSPIVNASNEVYKDCPVLVRA